MAALSSGCAVDTNVLIYHLHGALSARAEELLAAAIQAGARVSVVTRIELMCWPQHTADSLAATHRLLDLFHERPLAGALVERTISVRREARIRLADAVIAATALEDGVPLMTRNTKDFAAVAGLTVVDPESVG